MRDIGRLRLGSEALVTEFDRLLANIEQTQSSGRRFAEELGMDLLERLLLRAMEEDPQSPNKIMDPRIIEACQFIMAHLSGELRIDEVARHVCLSPSPWPICFGSRWASTSCAGGKRASGYCRCSIRSIPA